MAPEESIKSDVTDGSLLADRFDHNSEISRDEFILLKVATLISESCLGQWTETQILILLSILSQEKKQNPLQFVQCTENQSQQELPSRNVWWEG